MSVYAHLLVSRIDAQRRERISGGILTCPLVSTYGDLQVQTPLTQSAPEKQSLVEVHLVRCSCRALFAMLASSRPEGNACSRCR